MSAFKKLFNHMAGEHRLTLLESEMQEISHLCVEQNTELQNDLWTRLHRAEAENRSWHRWATKNAVLEREWTTESLQAHITEIIGDRAEVIADLRRELEAMRKTSDTQGMTIERPPLFIPLKREYFEAFERGEKTEEFRPYGPRWNEKTCVVGRRVTLSLGYGNQRRIYGRVVGFVTDSQPLLLPGWLACYGSKAGVQAARIGIRIDSRLIKVCDVSAPRPSH